MTDYKTMYMTLCAAVDDVIDPLEQLAASAPYAKKLKEALLAAEEIYIDTSADEDETR